MLDQYWGEPRFARTLGPIWLAYPMSNSFPHTTSRLARRLSESSITSRKEEIRHRRQARVAASVEKLTNRILWLTVCVTVLTFFNVGVTIAI